MCIYQNNYNDKLEFESDTDTMLPQSFDKFELQKMVQKKLIQIVVACKNNGIF